MGRYPRLSFWLLAFGTLTLTPSAVASASSLFDIALRKQYVPVLKDGKPASYKTAYFGQVYVGTPQKAFSVVFDTGSGHVIVPSTACKSETCQKHRSYSRADSSSAVDIEYDGKAIATGASERDQVAISFGTGQVTGEFVWEIVCASQSNSSSCVALRLVLATEMTNEPFGLFNFDGVLGLGLEALALKPQFSFFGQMAQHIAQERLKLKPQFAVHLGKSDDEESTISFGGYSEHRALSPLAWVPVVLPELGYWQVKIKSIQVGNEALDFCDDGSCRAILDTGTSLLGVPRQASRSLHRSLARAVSEESAKTLDCRDHPGPDIVFELEGAVISLGPEDYSRPQPFSVTVPAKDATPSRTQHLCRALLLPVDMKAPMGPKVFILGEPVLRRYYTVYDWGARQVGLAPAKPLVTSDGGAGTSSSVIGRPEPASRMAGAALAAGGSLRGSEATQLV